jgi:integrase
MSIYRDKTRGRFIFEFDVRIDGQRIRTRKILPKAWTRAQAETFDEKERARLYAQVRGGERVTHQIDDSVTIYLEHRIPELKNGDGCMKELLRLAWAYEGKPLEKLPEVCRDISVEGRKAGSSAATIRNRIRYLTAACRYAWKHHGVGLHDPAERVAVPEVNNERHEYASRKQMLQLARAMHPVDKRKNAARESRAVLRIGFYSGMRLAEILRAEPRGDCFHLGTTKNGQPRIVPIHPKIRTCLWIYQQSLPAKRTVQKQFSLARARVEMDHLHFHDVRHSAASEMINAGIDLYTVGAVLGHKDSRSTQRYAHLATDTLALAIGKIGQKIPHRGNKKAA